MLDDFAFKHVIILAVEPPSFQNKATCRQRQIYSVVCWWMFSGHDLHHPGELDTYTDRAFDWLYC